MTSALSRFMPHARLRETDRVAVACEPADAWRFVRDADLYDLEIVRALFTLRTLPERVGARLRGSLPVSAPVSARLDDIVAGPGFHLLAEEPGKEFVVGAIGKFWEPAIPFTDTSAQTFADEDAPGLGKVAWSLEVQPRVGGGAWVSVDVRVDATDEQAWARFLRYWTLIGPFSRLIRRLYLRRVTAELGRAAPDADRTLPGDELVADASTAWTDSVTLEAPPSQVWPWLAQMGCQRAGWYSHDLLDNGGVSSADRILPELQQIAVGDILPATPKGPDGFAVLRVEPARALVLGSPDLLPADAREKLPASWGMLGARYSATWAFVLEPIGDDATRLVVRVRGNLGAGLRDELARSVLHPVHAIMEHAQLRNLKRRVEHTVA